ncbi:PLDc_N domain-containing protein [Antrihabitans sp. YC3-6]|uniref:PLDc_N domain-containing protein n=1 Tax=Antrihabitans stalagmiti TaxID=2799499 RepID=A0A934U5U6_9NOCA|nr:PLD nuclease N-terminal domain-containing protein [Antrihabitans stalagmiti]MBJ8341253.1 PLDc_N domain-containing protein [Antrihabitans stalagmiti]
MTHKRWADLSPAAQSGISILAISQLALAIAAWVDLARRPAEEVRGRKPLWAAAIVVNFVGPIAYFRWGRTGSSEVSGG